VRRGLVLAVALLAVPGAPGTARAGRTFYGWLYGTEVMPERGAEIQSFVAEENRQSAAANESETDWWLSPAIGINDQLELLLPIEMDWTVSDVQGPRFALVNFGGEVRYRFVTSDPTDKPPLVPLIRFAVKRQVTGPRDVWQPEADLVASYDLGRTQLLADVGAVGEISENAQHFELRPGAGVSVLAAGEVRFGAEVFAEIALDNNGDGSWVAAGPNIAWSHGRTWLSAAYGIGLFHIRDAPKFNWGIAF
jgi:hypothetical protein